MTRGKILIACILSLIILATGGGYFAYIHLAQKAAMDRIAISRCPEDYKTEAEKVYAFLNFFNDYVDANPKAKGNINIIDAGRTDFLISHHCIATLMNFGYDGVSPIDAKIRQELITAMDNG